MTALCLAHATTEGNPGSRTCHSELRPYLDAYSAVLEQDGRNADWVICQRHVVFCICLSHQKRYLEMEIYKQLSLVCNWLLYDESIAHHVTQLVCGSVLVPLSSIIICK